MDTIVDVGGFLLLVAIVLTIVIRRSLRRDRAWPSAAAAIGLSYAKRDDSVLERFGTFKTLDARGVRYILNVTSGTHGRLKAWVADYQYSNDLTGTVAPHGFTLGVMQGEDVRIPHFLLESSGRPRSMTNTPKLRRPEDDPLVPFDDESEFSRSFSLRTASPDAVLRLLTPALRNQLLKVRPPYLDVEAKGGTVIVTRRSWLEPRNLAAFVDEAAKIAEALLDSARWTRPAS